MNNKVNFGDLKKRINKLEQDEQYYRLIAENSTDMISKHDPKGVYKYASPFCHTLLGYTADELVGQNSYDFFHPDDLENIKNSHQQILKRETIEIISYRIRHKKGHYIWVETTSKTIKNLNTGEIEEIIATTRDITERKRAEEVLESQNRLMSTLLDNLQVGVFMVEAPNGKPLLANRRAKELLGRGIMNGADTTTIADIYQAYKQGTDEIYPKDELPIVRGLLGESCSVNDMVVVQPSGKRVLLEVFGSPVKDNQGNVIASLVSFSDISERKKAEKALADERNKLETVTQNVGVGLAVISKDYRTIWANKVISDIFGDVVGKLCHLTYNNREEICPGCGVKEVFTKGKELVTHEQMGEDAYGNKIWSQIVTTPIKDEDGNITSALEAVLPITERKQLEEERRQLESQLQQAQKMEAIGALAGGIAHDFNNILFPLVGYAEMLKQDLPADHKFQANADTMLRSALRAKALVQQILTFSRKTEFEIRPIKLQPIVKESIKLIRSSLPKTIDIQQNIDSDCGLVSTDPTRVHQIIMNLATNAYHAMELAGGGLTITLKQIHVKQDSPEHSELLPGPYACLTVADTGVGMGKDVIEKVFDPYFTTKESGKGTGLGLSVVHGIIKECGGDIRIYSEPGKGTDIHVYIPIIETKPEKKTETTGPVIGGTERILLVDDEKAIADMEQQMLERLGYHVTIRTGSVEALEAFKSNPDKFDLIITDMTMPNMTGVQLAKEIKHIKTDIPIIICSGFSDQLTDEKCRALGIYGYILKPVIIRELAEIIRNVFDTSEES